MQKSVLSELKEREKLVRRSIILDAAEKEFAEKPFNRVTMRTIATRAGISPAIIYRHFPDQQSLFVEAFMKGTNHIFEKIFSMIKESNDGALEQAISTYIEYFTMNDQYFRMMMNFFLSQSDDPDLFEKLTAIERNILDHLDIIFEKMQLQGNIRYHSQTLFAALTGIVATFRSHPQKSTGEILSHREKIAHHLAGLFRNC